jgi:hypothetical protein
MTMERVGTYLCFESSFNLSSTLCASALLPDTAARWNVSAWPTIRGERRGVYVWLTARSTETLIPKSEAEIPRNAINASTYWLGKWERSFSFSLQNNSSMSLSGIRSSVTFTVKGLKYILGSSMVTCRSIWPKSWR